MCFRRTSIEMRIGGKEFHFTRSLEEGSASRAAIRRHVYYLTCTVCDLVRRHWLGGG